MTVRERNDTFASPMAWRLAQLPVLTAAAPQGTVRLATLSEPAGAERHRARLRPSCRSDRDSALLALHHVVLLVGDVLVAPAHAASVEVRVGPEHLGLVLDADGHPAASWCVPLGSSRPADPRRVGARVAELLAPTLAVAATAANLDRRRVETIALDALTGLCRRLDRHRVGAVDGATAVGFTEALLEATGLRSPRAERHVLVEVDGDTEVPLPVPRVCCVLAPALSCRSCPTCPLRGGDAELRRAAAAWLGSLDDEGFLDVTGRRRGPATVTP